MSLCLPLAVNGEACIGSDLRITITSFHVMLMARGRAAIPMSVTVKHVCTHTQSRFTDKNMKKNTNLVKVTETKRKIDARATRLASTSGDARRATPTGLV